MTVKKYIHEAWIFFRVITRLCEHRICVLIPDEITHRTNSRIFEVGASRNTSLRSHFEFHAYFSRSEWTTTRARICIRASRKVGIQDASEKTFPLRSRARSQYTRTNCNLRSFFGSLRVALSFNTIDFFRKATPAAVRTGIVYETSQYQRNIQLLFTSLYTPFRIRNAAGKADREIVSCFTVSILLK